MGLPVKINQNTLVPSYQAVLVNGNGSVANLTGATVQFLMTALGSTVPKVSAGASIVSAAGGSVEHVWAVGNTDTLGLFEVRWLVTYGDGSMQTYPSDNTDLIEVVTGPNPGYQLQGACAPWTTIQQARLAGTSLPASGDPEYLSDSTVQSAINVATDLMFTLSGQQFPGECMSVIRPCSPRNCYGAGRNVSSWGWSGPVLDESAYPAPPCGCGFIASIDLGFWPVTNIVQVKVDGTVVSPATYRLDQNRYLTRMNGAGGWPSCQALDLPSSSAGTFEVMLEHGMRPPAAGAYATARLAAELLKASIGQPCHLPSRVTTVNRQQLTFTMINPSMLDNGLTGLYEVDMFLMAYNPAKQRGQTMVWSPDLQHQSYRAGA